MHTADVWGQGKHNGWVLHTRTFLQCLWSNIHMVITPSAGALNLDQLVQLVDHIMERSPTLTIAITSTTDQFTVEVLHGAYPTVRWDVQSCQLLCSRPWLEFCMMITTPTLADPCTNCWVKVNKDMTQHMRYLNVFAIRDCSNVLTNKIAATTVYSQII